MPFNVLKSELRYYNPIQKGSAKMEMKNEMKNTDFAIFNCSC